MTLTQRALDAAGFAWRCLWIGPLVLALLLLALVALIGWGPRCAGEIVDDIG